MSGSRRGVLHRSEPAHERRSMRNGRRRVPGRRRLHRRQVFRGAPRRRRIDVWPGGRTVHRAAGLSGRHVHAGVPAHRIRLQQYGEHLSDRRDLQRHGDVLADHQPARGIRLRAGPKRVRDRRNVQRHRHVPAAGSAAGRNSVGYGRCATLLRRCPRIGEHDRELQRLCSELRGRGNLRSDFRSVLLWLFDERAVSGWRVSQHQPWHQSLRLFHQLPRGLPLHDDRGSELLHILTQRSRPRVTRT